MSQAPTSSAGTIDWQRRGWLVAPSWLLSLVLHGGLLAMLAVTLHRAAPVGSPLGLDREVGIYFGSNDANSDFPGEGGDAGYVGDAATEEVVASSERSIADAHDELRVDKRPPVELALPTVRAAGIGPGIAMTGDTSAPASSTVRASGGSGLGEGGGGGGGGGGGTSFFGARGSGQRFVYVLDASGSMLEYGAIRVAKAELLASLAQLGSDQQFQIVFYNEKNFPMVAPGGKSQLFRGTDANRNLASQFINGVNPDGGTRHLTALLEALNYVPDVIYFLTDAGEPRLEAGDLDRIKRRNNGRTQIHAIEFGKGPQLKAENFLKRLARENGGAYVYRDVQQFGKR
ncbi:MAG: vWA domain-containing protein [Planctomycetaceae bacterium]